MGNRGQQVRHRNARIPATRNSRRCNISQNPYAATDTDVGRRQVDSFRSTRTASLTILAVVVVGSVLSKMFGGRGPNPSGIGLVAAFAAGFMIVTTAAWEIVRQVRVASPRPVRVSAILKAAAGRILALVVAGILTVIIVDEGGASMIPGPDFTGAGAIGAIFGFVEALLVSLSYRLSFRRTPTWPIYLWPVLIHVLSCGVGMGVFIWLEDQHHAHLVLGVAIGDLATPLFLAMVGGIEINRVAAFALVTSTTTPEQQEG